MQVSPPNSFPENEIVKAINENDYAYLVDLGGLDQEVNLGFKITKQGHVPLQLAVLKGL